MMEKNLGRLATTIYTSAFSLMLTEQKKNTTLTLKQVQSNLCTTTNLGTQNLWQLLTGGSCSEVGLCYKNLNWDSKIVVAVGRWSLFRGGR